MNRDGVKTVIGLLVIGLIIVATFLYGNNQRQAQLRHDQDLKRLQSVSQTSPQTTPKAAPTPSKSTALQPGVPAPTSNPIQGRGNAVTTAPQTGGTVAAGSSSTPKTGPDAIAPIALLALIGAGVYYRRSRRELASALVATKRR